MSPMSNTGEEGVQSTQKDDEGNTHAEGRDSSTQAEKVADSKRLV